MVYSSWLSVLYMLTGNTFLVIGIESDHRKVRIRGGFNEARHLALIVLLGLSTDSIQSSLIAFHNAGFKIQLWPRFRLLTS